MTNHHADAQHEPDVPIIFKDGVIEAEADVVPTGRVRFAVVNDDEQDRELLVGRPGVLTLEPDTGWANRRFQVVGKTGPIAPGERATVEVDLIPGSYSLLGIPPPDDIRLMEHRVTAQPSSG